MDISNICLRLRSMLSLPCSQEVPDALNTPTEDSKLHAQDVLGAFNIATELIQGIASHCDVVSKVSLALTSRTLYTICFPEDLTMEESEKELLALLLERDLPNYYYCHSCFKLHEQPAPWDKLASWDYRFWECGSLSSVHLASKVIYPYARAVMNRHFYGPEHGPTLDQFSHQSEEEAGSTRTVQNTSQCTRIIEDQLIVCTKMNISHRRGNAQALRRHLIDHRLHVCEHLHLGRENEYRYRSQIPETIQRGDKLGRFTECCNSHGSCVFCLTDYSIDISWQGEKKGYIISITTYRVLGDCRSPNSMVWRNMSKHIIRERSIRKFHYRLGYARDLWNTADSIEDETRGKWTQTPRENTPDEIRCLETRAF